MQLQLSFIPALSPEEAPFSPPESLTCVMGEETHVQLCISCQSPAHLSIVSDAPEGSHPHLLLQKVEKVPCGLVVPEVRDEDYLYTAPGEYPDRLVDLSCGPEIGTDLPPCHEAFFFLSVRADAATAAHDMTLTATLEAQGTSARAALPLRVFPDCLPPLPIHHTQWFHADCLADYYHVPVFSEEHWAILRRFMVSLHDHMVNLILTPIFPPPLDVLPEGERTPVQLVDVEEDEEGQFSFRYDRFDRWVDLARACGIFDFEISHLFTQWGVKYAPRILVRDTDGSLRRLFPWSEPGTGDRYLAFLDSFLPSLVNHLRETGLEGHAFFHISDEPGEKDIETYRKAAAFVIPRLQGFPTMDALSCVRYSREGLVQTPVVSLDHLDPFLEDQVHPLWGYYCCAQGTDVPNRFISMPRRRSRILGTLLYVTHLQGFLHWGFNFYNAQFSLRHLDPHQETDAGHAFPSGDAFLVYPEEGGIPGESIRGKILRDGLMDLRLLYYLESRFGRERVLSLIRDIAGYLPDMRRYPREDAFFERLWDAAGHMLRDLQFSPDGV